MQFSETASALLPWLLAILVAIIIWAVIELALSFRRVRKTLDGVDETVKKADPLIDHATLTVDAVNLEIMRLDQILEDVEQVTDTASNAVDAVDTVVNAPREIATSVADFVRGSVKDRNRKRAADKKLASEKDKLGEAQPAEDMTEHDTDKSEGITIIASPIDGEETSQESAATSEDSLSAEGDTGTTDKSEDDTDAV